MSVAHVKCNFFFLAYKGLSNDKHMEKKDMQRFILPYGVLHIHSAVANKCGKSFSYLNLDYLFYSTLIIRMSLGTELEIISTVCRHSDKNHK